MNLLILSNCSHVGLARYARALEVFDTVQSYAVYDADEAGQAVILNQIDKFDCVLSLRHGDGWGELATDRLKQRLGDRMLSFASIHFTGLHPDLCVLENRAGKRTSDLHLASVLRFHQHGVRADVAARRLREGKVPAAIDALANWNQAIENLTERDGTNDISICDIVEEECRAGAAMMTFNHPGMSIIARVARRAIERWIPDTELRPIDPRSIRHDLSNMGVWPVLDYVAEQLGLTYRTPQRMQLCPTDATADLSLEEYVARAYAFYDSVGSRHLSVAAPAYLAGLVNKPPALAA